jgi:hypothetical protein
MDFGQGDLIENRSCRLDQYDGITDQRQTYRLGRDRAFDQMAADRAVVVVVDWRFAGLRVVPAIGWPMVVVSMAAVMRDVVLGPPLRCQTGGIGLQTGGPVARMMVKHNGK